MGRGRSSKSPKMCSKGCNRVAVARGLCDPCYKKDRYYAIKRGDWKPKLSARKKRLPDRTASREHLLEYLGVPKGKGHAGTALEECERLAIAAALDFHEKYGEWGEGADLLDHVSKPHKKSIGRGVLLLLGKGVLRHCLIPTQDLESLSNRPLSSFVEEATSNHRAGKEGTGGLVRGRGRDEHRLSCVSGSDHSRDHRPSNQDDVEGTGLEYEEGALEADGLCIVSLDDIQYTTED